jgi:hypothetical protein
MIAPRKDRFSRSGFLIEFVAVTLVLVWVYCANLQAVSFHADESQWIATSYYFEALLDEHLTRPSSIIYAPPLLPNESVWAENYWTLTQPPVARYLIALGRRLGGYQVKDLNIPWVFAVDVATNQSLGSFPAPGLLWWSRLPMALLTVGSGLLFFGLVRSCAGRLSGYAFVGLFVTTPYFLIHLRRAMGEAPLTFLTGLALAAGWAALTAWERIRQKTSTDPRSQNLSTPFFYLILMGLAAGLAGATKLNGLGLPLAGMSICYLIYRGSQEIIAPAVRESFALRSLVLLLFAAGVVFVTVNPYLYPDPLGRTLLMFQHRRAEMAYQITKEPQIGIPDLAARLQIVPQRIFKDYLVLNFPGAWIVNVGLFGLGTYFLLRTAQQWLANKGGTSASVAALAVASVTVLPALLTPLDLDRYYLFPILFVSCSIAIGIGRSLTTLYSWLRSYLQSRE